MFLRLPAAQAEIFDLASLSNLVLIAWLGFGYCLALVILGHL